MNTLVTVDRPASMTEQEWRKAIKFDSTDWGWIIMSIGMAIGAGIVFLPVKIGLVGLWVFLVSSVIAYPAMYLFQRLFINTLAESPECKDYPSVISGYLGKNWGFFIGILYFIMLVIWVFIYSTALTNDSASFLHSFGVTKTVWSHNPFYGLVVICIMVAIASRAEKILFRISTVMVLTKLSVVTFLGLAIMEPGERRGLPELGLPGETDHHHAPIHIDLDTLHPVTQPDGHLLPGPLQVNRSSTSQGLALHEHRVQRTVHHSLFLCHLLQLNHGT